MNSPSRLVAGSRWVASTLSSQAEGCRSPVLGIDDLILDLLEKRATRCEHHAYRCDLCRGTLRSGEAEVIAAKEVELKADKATPHLCGTCPYKGQPLPSAAVANGV